MQAGGHPQVQVDGSEATVAAELGEVLESGLGLRRSHDQRDERHPEEWAAPEHAKTVREGGSHAASNSRADEQDEISTVHRRSGRGMAGGRQGMRE